jgi:hypothetical protein
VGLEPTSGDYEKYGPALRARYLHGYYEVTPPVTLIAPYARVSPSTNRSTPYRGDHRMPATERYRRPADQLPRRVVQEEEPLKPGAAH